MTLKDLIKILHSNTKVCKTGKCQVNANYENNNKSKEMEEKE